jgi:hypothetical protein
VSAWAEEKEEEEDAFFLVYTAWDSTRTGIGERKKRNK